MSPMGALSIAVVVAMGLSIAIRAWGEPLVRHVPLPPLPPVCVDDEEMRDHSRKVMLDGLDAALKEQTGLLYSNRLKDRERHPDRLIMGMRNALFTYTRSREEVMKWQPPNC